MPRFSGLTALVAWAGPLGFGLLPALTRSLSEASALGDHAAERRLVSFGILLTVGMMLVSLCVTVVAGQFADVHGLVGAAAVVTHVEVTAGFVAAVGIVSIHFFAATSSAIRAGYQEMHWTSGWSIAANLAIIAAVFAARDWFPTIAGFALALYAPFTLFYLIDYFSDLSGRDRTCGRCG